MPSSTATTVLGLALAFASPGLLSQPSPQPTRHGERWTQEWSDEAAPAPRVKVQSIGPVTVWGTDRGRIRYRLVTQGRASRGQEWLPVVFRESGIVIEQRPGGIVALTLRDPVCGDCRVNFLLEIEVPQETAEVDLLTTRGSIDVRGIAGSVNARAIGGPIVIDEIAGSVAASTAGGSIRLGKIGGSVLCDTAGGSIELTQSGTAMLRTSVGSIRAKNIHGDLDAETGGGNIEIGRVEGKVEARTVGGSIRVAEVAQGMRAEAGAGDIWIQRASGALLLTSGAGDIVAALQDGTVVRDSILETSVGSILISLPETLAVTLDASIQMARGLRGIVSEFPSIEVHRSEEPFGPVAEKAAGTINGGGSVVRIRNRLGRIEIRKQQ